MSLFHTHHRKQARSRVFQLEVFICKRTPIYTGYSSAISLHERGTQSATAVGTEQFNFKINLKSPSKKKGQNGCCIANYIHQQRTHSVFHFWTRTATGFQLHSPLFSIQMLAETNADGKVKSKPPRVKWRLQIAWYRPWKGKGRRHRSLLQGKL